MRKLLSILFVFALTLGFMAGEKRIVGTKINNQVMLLRIDLANYSMEASTDGTNWTAIPGTSGIADNALSLSLLAQIPTASVLGNVSGTTGNVTPLSASDLKTLIGDATTSVSGLMSASDKSKVNLIPAALGTAGQALTVNSGATALEFTTISATPTWDSITGKPIELTEWTIEDSGKVLSASITGDGFGNATIDALASYVQAAWKFSDGALLADSSSGGNTLSNNGTVTQLDGKSGKAAVFSGSNYLSRSSGNITAGASTVLISAWVKPSALGNVPFFFESTSDNVETTRCYVGIDDAGGHISFGARIVSAGSGVYFTSSSTIASGSYSHILALIDTSNNIGRISINGTIESQAMSFGGSPIVNDTSASGTLIASNTVSLFSGQIDELYIWKNASLSESDFSALASAIYNSGTGRFYGDGLIKSTSLIGNATTSAPGLMSASDKTKLDSLATSTAFTDLTDTAVVSPSDGQQLVYRDTAKAPASGLLINFPLTSSTPTTSQSVTNTGVTFASDTEADRNVGVFNGSSYLSFAEASMPTGNPTLTIFAYVKIGSGMGTADGVIFGYGKNDSTNNCLSGLLIATTYFGFHPHGGGGTGFTASHTFDVDKWYAVCATRNGTTAKLYVDGAEIASGTYDTTNLTQNDGCNVGRYVFADAAFFNGKISKLLVYNRVLTDSEIVGLSASVKNEMKIVNATVTSGMSNPMTTAGDLIIGGTSGTPARLAPGTDGYVLTLASGSPAWAASASSGLLKASGSGYALDNGSTGRGTVGTKSVSLEYSESGSGFGATGIHSVVSGGMNNTASGNSSTVGGGFNNTASMGSSTVGGGSSNTASDVYATVSGGGGNTASNNHATVVGGFGNNASGDSSTVGGGSSNTASGAHSFASGQSNTASAPYSMACGYEGVSSHYGGFSWAAGRFSAFGDSQKGWVSARIATSSTDATILYLDGSSEKFTLVPGDHYSCRIHLIGAQADGSTGDYYAIVKIKNVSGTTSLSGTVRVIEAWEGDTNLGTPTISITADDTNDCLQIAVTPANATATRWTAVIEYVKINY